MRKKFTMLFAALLACAGVMKAEVTDLPQITTDLENPIYYTIYNTRSQEPGGLMYYAGDAVGLKDGCTSLTLADEYKFFFTGSHEELYVHNAATTKKLASVSSWTEDGIAWTVTAPTANGLAFGPKGETGDVFWNDKNYSTDANTSDFTTWGNTDAGSIFVVERAENCVFPSSGLFYTIECPLFKKVQGVAKGLVADANGSLSWNTVDLTDKNFYWTLVESEGNVVLKNVGTGLYINGAAVAETGATVTINALGSNLFNIISNGVTIHANGHGNGANASGSIVHYGGAINSASAWSFVERKDPDAVIEVSVVYNFKYDGVTMYTQQTNTLVGEAYPVVSVSHPFGVSISPSSTVPEGVIEAGDVVEGVVTVDFNLDVNTPFKFADSYENVSWYFLKFDSSNNFYLHHDAGQTFIDLDSKSFEADNDNYYWGFVGDPFAGYQIVNKGAGKDYILSSSTTMAGTTGADTWPIMTEMPVTDGNNTLWIATSSSHGDNGFFLAQKDYPTHRMNNRGKLAYWTDGAGTGSTFMVEEPEVALAAVVAAFKENALNTLGYVGGYSADKAEAIQAIETYEQMVAFEANNTEVIALDVNKYYRIKNVFRNKVLSVNANNERVSADLNNAEISQIWKFEEGATEGTYLIKSSNADAYMLGAGASNTLAAEGAEFVLHNLTYGQFNLKQQNSNNLMCIYSGGGIGSWTGGGAGSDMAWYIVPATTIEYTLSDIDGEGYATAYLPFDVTLDEGVNAYAIESTNSTHAILAEKEDIPANEGAILIGTPGTHTFNIATASSEWTGNMLTGTTVNTYVKGAAYVLANGTNGVGLYKAELNKDANGADGDTHFKNNANKAYLVVEGANAPMFSFNRGEGTTGIDKAQLTMDNVVIYDLLGRRVEKMEKGIYIVNGKKIIK